MDDQDDDYHLPLPDQRVFGAGISRKHIYFIPSSTPTPLDSNPADGRPISDKYLSIVLPSSATSTLPPDQANSTASIPPQPEQATATILCEICNLPLPPSDSVDSRPHESSIAHQSCLPHSHPPSHLPRDHIGLKYLEAYGWDPDARTGLGASEQGIRIPIKGKVKNDTVGLGVKVKKVNGKVEEQKPQKNLHAKEVRKVEMEKKRKGEKLREKFYGSEDLERYLGGG
jgi:hypothetical protein